MRVRGFVAAGGALVMGLTAACGATATKRVSVQTAIAAAATKSASAQTFRLNETGTADMSVASDTTRISSSGDFDLANQRVSLTMRIVGTDGSSSGSGGGTATSPTSFTMSVIQVGDKSWIKSSELKTGNKWVENDDSGSGSLASFPSPAKVFSMLRSGATSVKLLGTTTVDKATTDHYEMSVPTAFFNSLGGDSSAGTAEPGATSVQVWVDRSDLIRRMSATVSQSGETSTFTIDFSDYGQPMNIQPPPPNQVASMQSIIPTVTPDTGSQ